MNESQVPMSQPLPIPRRLRSRSGLSLVELVVAMLVLTIGILGMAAGTGWMIRSVDLAQLETSRSAALQSAVEEVRAVGWDDYADGQGTYGNYTVTWRQDMALDQRSRLVTFQIEGPGRPQGAGGAMPVISADASTTVEYRMNRP